jgi:hypothetical protein
MPYTVWSHGRLLGESALDYRRVFPRHRMGDFLPTEAGEKIMPIATGVSKAGVEVVKSLSGSPPGSAARTHLRESSEYADLAAAEDQYDALELELRGPDGSVIPTEWIDLRDTEYLLTIPDLEDIHGADAAADLWAEIDEEFGEPPADLIDDPLDFGDFEAEDDFDFDIDDFDDDEPWRAQRVFPRYQLQVMLRDEASVP